MIKIAICDDEKQECDTIEQYITSYKEAHPVLTFNISVFSSGEELLSAYHNGKNFDFLFLDIQMKDIDGIQVAKEIRKTNKHAIIFFITGFTQYVSAAFSLQAFQFLLKPVKKDSFEREFRRALKKYFTEHKKYIIESDSRTVYLEIKDIVYIESSNHHIIVHTEQNEYIKRGKINSEELLLSPYGFVRIHHSYIVNLAYVFELTFKNVVLKNNIKIAVSKRKHTEVKSRFNNFMAGGSICSD